MNTSNSLKIGWWLRTISVVFLLSLGLTLSASSQTPNEDYAILIVGDEGNQEMLREEKILISEMGKILSPKPAQDRLPIYSYHFNKERERAYCENRLNVLSEDLLFVGIVQLKDKVPLKVVYRVDRINNPTRAAKDILARADEIVAAPVVEVPKSEPSAPESAPEIPQETPSETPSTEPSPSPSTSAPSSTTPTTSTTPSSSVGSGFRVQLGSFSQLKYAQDKRAEAERASLEVSIVESKTANGDVLYKVLSPLMVERVNADNLLKRFHDAGFEEAFLSRAGE